MRTKLNLDLTPDQLIGMANVRIAGLTSASTMPGKCEVRMYIDTSGSFNDEWKSGLVQQLFLRVAAVAHILDANGSLDIFHFNDDVHSMGSIKFATLPKNWLQNQYSRIRFGGTQFNPVFKSAESSTVLGSAMKVASGLFSMFNTPKKAPPNLVYILTDGECTDAREATTTAAALQDGNTYFMFVNVDVLSAAAKKLSDNYPHIGHKHFPNLSTITDEEFMGALLTPEFMTWRANQG